MKKLNILRKQLALALTFGVLMGLAACGGGGGGGDDDVAPNPPTNPTEPPTEPTLPAEPYGVYEGTVSSGREHYTIILEDNQFYTLYGNFGNTLYFYGFLHGNGNVSGNIFTSSNLRDYFSTEELVTGSLSATFVPGVSFNGSVIYDGATPSASFTGSVMPTTYYDYNVAAKLSDITGAWSLTSLQNDPITMNIASTGSFTATSRGCAMNGNILPRASGKNVFNISMNFGPLPCRLPGQSASGIAVIHLLANGKHELLIAGTNTSQTVGTVMFGTR
jgi:hypothetical protein